MKLILFFESRYTVEFNALCAFYHLMELQTIKIIILRDQFTLSASKNRFFTVFNSINDMFEETKGFLYSAGIAD